MKTWLSELEGWRRQFAIAAVVGVSTILLGALIGTILGTAGSGSSSHSGGITARLPELDPGTLMVVPKADPSALHEPRGMGSKKAGIALLAMSTDDSVITSKGERRAPDGGSLVIFKVGDWACEDTPCDPWSTLKPQVVVDGQATPLPDGGTTFVLVLSPGTATVNLTINDAGYAQSLSLVNDGVGKDNITLLAHKHTETKVEINKTYQLAERTSIPLQDSSGSTTNQFVRNTTITYAQRHFFLDGQEPSKPDKAFLVINAYYAYGGSTQTYVFGAGEATFVARNGTSYQAKDLDPSTGVGLLGFEVPASVRSGTLVIGGTIPKVSTTGTAYTSNLAQVRVPIKLG
ncbi:MAG: hypothetical protein JWP74_3341 [Marmoricola sp.]|nr:hypothetical protein [Marmoricola sp.]